MAAFDMFENYIRSLGAAESEALKDVIRERRKDLFAARSEDARIRLVDEFITELQEKRGPVRRS